MAKTEDFASLMEQTIGQTARTGRRLRQGEQVEGTIVQIGSDCVFVDIGTPADARIDRAELADATGRVSVSVGDRLTARVVDARPDAPVLALTMGRGSPVDSAGLRLARETGTPVEGTVSQVIKGGIEVAIGPLRAFCPASQVDSTYVENLDGYVGQTLAFRVVEVRDEGRSVVVSRRALLEQQRREREQALRTQLTPGSEVEGVVRTINRHGVVVDLGGVDGFAHISELAPYRVQSAQDLVHTGDHVTARVLALEETERGLRVKLSLKQAMADKSPPPQPDQVLAGTVVGATAGGLIVATPRGEGFVPIRELELAPGADHRRAYPPGKPLSVVAIEAGTSRRLRLSARQVAEVVERRNFAEYSSSGAGPASASAPLGSLGDVLRSRLGLSEEGPAPGAQPAPSGVSRRGTGRGLTHGGRGR
ncbi:MAG: S1 RNA-binding domain-containing protein [Polyangiaceae bacterium]|nr:S1 RNA-binding domain-containing protein [Polyangiaceae bacterium]